jgi:hypothetical protein
MKLKTTIHTRRILHVQVPANTDAGKLENDLQYTYGGASLVRLKDGITVDTDDLMDNLENNADDWHYRELLDSALKLTRWRNCTEIFFHQ